MPRRAPHAYVVLVEGDDDVVTWPLRFPARPDLGLADALARLQLEAQRVGCSIRLVDPSTELLELLEVVGLTEVLVAPLGSEVPGQAEHLEEAGVEEVVMPDDPVA